MNNIAQYLTEDPSNYFLQKILSCQSIVVLTPNELTRLNKAWAQYSKNRLENRFLEETRISKFWTYVMPTRNFEDFAVANTLEVFPKSFAQISGLPDTWQFEMLGSIVTLRPDWTRRSLIFLTAQKSINRGRNLEVEKTRKYPIYCSPDGTPDYRRYQAEDPKNVWINGICAATSRIRLSAQNHKLIREAWDQYFEFKSTINSQICQLFNIGINWNYAALQVTQGAHFCGMQIKLIPKDFRVVFGVKETWIHNYGRDNQTEVFLGVDWEARCFIKLRSMLRLTEF